MVACPQPSLAAAVAKVCSKAFCTPNKIASGAAQRLRLAGGFCLWPALPSCYRPITVRPPEWGRRIVCREYVRAETTTDS